MSEGSQNIGDEQAVVGEPASHPHQAVVVGEPPENVAPVLGEPAFANGLQDQQPIHPLSADENAANGIPSSPHIPHHEEGLASLVPSSHVSAPSSGAPVEDSPNSQHVPSTELSDSGIPVTENSGPSDFHVDEVSSALDAPVGDAETPVTANTHEAVRSAVDEPAADFPDVVEVTHIVDSPSESPLPPSDVSTGNPFSALDEGPASAPEDLLANDAPSTDGAPVGNASSTLDEFSPKGPGDQQEEDSLSSAVQEKQLTENSSSTQTDVEDGPLKFSEDASGAELKQVGNGDTLAWESDAKEANLAEDVTGSSVKDHPLTPELDQATEKDASAQGNDTKVISAESETTTGKVEHDLSRDVPESEVSTESPTPKKGLLNENQTASTASELQSNEEVSAEAPTADSSLAPQGTRDIAVEECLVNQPPAANGDNGYRHGEDSERALEREQDLPKDDDDTSAEVEKPSSRIKFPLIFTGLAIAAVGVAVASISRPH